MVELGRHQRIDREYRYFPICFRNDIHVLKDEMHFMFVCPLYDTLRSINQIISQPTKRSIEFNQSNSNQPIQSV